MQTKEPFDYARGLMLGQRPKCPRCSEMMVVQRRGVFLWACVRVGRCRETLPLDQVKFREWATHHGISLAPPEPIPEKPSTWQAPPRCPICDSRMTLRKNKKQASEFWGCTEFPKCKGVRGTGHEF